MLFLSHLFTKSNTQHRGPRLSKLARQDTLAHLQREIAATVRIDPQRAAEIAREKLASLGVELAQ